MTFAPMLDVARDPRWGRIVESPGEDPWVAAKVAAAKTRGFQGHDLAAADSVAATAKHLGAYGAVTAGREYAATEVSERTLHEVNLPPFAAAVAAGTAAIMPAFNDIAGAPMTANAPLLQGWLRGRLGFDGVLISDYNAIAELLDSWHGGRPRRGRRPRAQSRRRHRHDGRRLRERSPRGAATRPRRQGRDRRQPCGACSSSRSASAFFDDPYRRGAAGAGASRGEAERRELARDVARRAIVLLTNSHGALPLAPNLERIAVVGPLAAAPGEMLGSWASAGRAEEAVSILAGLEAALPGRRIEYAPGVGVDTDDTSGVAAALEVCRDAEVVLLCLGEAAAMSGEAASRADLGLPGGQRAFAEAVLDLGRPVVALISSGRPLALPWLFERADAVVATWFLGVEAGPAIADVLTGAFNPTGRLPVTWPHSVGQAPIFYAQRPSGRPARADERYSSKYLDAPVTPQFPFGHGLSYSRFALRDLQCVPSRVTAHDSVEITVAVDNHGPVAGEATLFLFVRDPVASVARPVLELKDVRKLALAAGASGVATWSLPVASLAFLGPGLAPVLEPGRFEIHVGQSADPAQLLTGVIELVL